MGMQNSSAKKFCLVLIKPSHYDDDGYVIQWLRSPVPSNSLATVCGLSLDAARRRVLGPDVHIDVVPLDETNTHIRVPRVVKMIKKAGAGMVMLIGVQSNQFPRALDMARQLRRRGIQVAIGGFHVSGTIAMLKEREPHVREAEDMGVSLFAGEAEQGRLEQVLLDAYSGQLAPLYNFMADLPNLDGAVPPFLPADRIRRVLGRHTSFDAGRGCPFFVQLLHDHQCSGAKVEVSFAGGRCVDHPNQSRAGRPQLLYHRRQLCTEPAMGRHLRHDHSPAGGGEAGR